MKLIHTLDESVELQHEGVALFRYVYKPQVPAVESPRPYFHPLRTLKGNIVSGFRPHDHRWHHGLSMTCAHLSGHNFWGGPTFVDGEYRQLENNGQQTKDWKSINCGSDFFSQEVAWLDFGQCWVLSAFYRGEAQIFENYWCLHFALEMENVTDKPLIWGSPTTQGRENAGYGGLFWRGPREFVGGKMLAAEGLEGDEIMGKRSPYLAYIGQHDETDEFSTLVFVDDPQNPRYPTQWFARNTTPMVCPAFIFDEEYVQEPGETLSLSYKILIADGAWTREQIEAAL